MYPHTWPHIFYQSYVIDVVTVLEEKCFEFESIPQFHAPNKGNFKSLYIEGCTCSYALSLKEIPVKGRIKKRYRERE